MNRLVRWSLLAIILGSTLAPAAVHAQGDADAQAKTAERPGRLLVVSLPGVTWQTLRNHDLPSLEEFVAQAASADLATRSASASAGPGDAYLTISGGSRAATDPGVDGQVLAVDEESAGSAAGDIYARRTGDEPDGPFVSLTWPALLKANARQPFDTEIGLLTDTLADAGVSAAAIGNADGIDAVGDSYERQAGLGLADSTGVVPGGSLGKDLLIDDPAAAFGVRLDAPSVVAAFADSWAAAEPGDGSAGGVVLVEGSDLARTVRYRPLVDAERYSAMWDDALAHTDELFAGLMEEVDLAKDTVIVLGPYNRRLDRNLTLVAMAGPGIDEGYLRSASTQRPGFLTLVDIGPTILDRFGIERPVEMEGRPALVVASDDGSMERRDHLITLNRASRFREKLLVPTTTLVVLGFAAVLALSIAAHANGWGRRPRTAIAFAGLVALAVMPVSYLARIFPLERLGAGFYWAFLLGIAIAYPATWVVLARREGRMRGPLIAVLSLMAGVLIADVVSGSHLSLSAAFGYSATGNSRLYGISNYSYAQLAAATCIVAAWLAAVRPGRGGRVLSIGAMVVTLVVLGVPIWGSDVGGVLAFTPAVATFVVVITGRRIRLRTAIIGVAATTVALVAFGLLDLARAPSNRGHLGRLFERIGDEGLSPLVSVAHRKLLANLGVSTSSLWVLAIPLAIAFWVFLRRYPGDPYRQIVAAFTELRAGLMAALVAGVLGTALNDSGAIVGGIMAVVISLALAVLLLDLDDDPTPSEAVDREGDEVAISEPVRVTEHATS